MNTKFAIGIPTLNRADLLNDALQSYHEDFPNTHIVVVDNGGQPICVSDNTTILRYGKNIGVAASWNNLCHHVYNRLQLPNIILANDDVYLGKKEKEVLDFLYDHAIEDFMVCEKPDKESIWCNFVLPRKTFNYVGPFDENIWPAYFEDNDYAYRMKLKKTSYLPHPFLYPKIYRESMTLHKDKSTNARFLVNRDYYVRKWGGLPGAETFLIPFNNVLANVY